MYIWTQFQLLFDNKYYQMRTSKLDTDANNENSFVYYKNLSRHEYQKTFQYNVSLIKPEQKNSIYQQLVGRKILSQFFLQLFDSPVKKTRTQISQQKLSHIKSRSRTVADEILRTGSSLGKSRNIRQKYQTAKKVQNFNQTLKKFHKSMIVNKNRVNLLGRFNNVVKTFQDKLPKDPSQQTRQTIQQNENLIQMCLKDDRQKDQKLKIQKKYEQILRFSQPRVQIDLKRQFLKKKKSSKIRENLKKLKQKQKQKD